MKVPAGRPSVVLVSTIVGVLEVELQQTPDAVMVAPPFEVIVPPLLAPYLEIVEIADVPERVGEKMVVAT